MWFLSDFRFGQNNWHIGQVNPWDTKCLLSTCIFALVLILELYPHSVHVHVPSNCFANKEPTWASRSTTERIDVKYFGSIQLLKRNLLETNKILVVSWPMKTEGIFGGANLLTYLTNVTGTVDMPWLNVILKALPMLALILALETLECSTIKPSHEGWYLGVQSAHSWNRQST